MKQRTVYLLLFLLLSSALLGLKATPVRADEDWQRFVRGLTNRGYYDMAIYYLEGFRKTPSCPATLAPEIDFRIAVLSLELARTLPVRQRADILERSQKNIVDFLNKSPQHPVAGEAYATLARLYSDEGKDFLKQSETASDQASQNLRRTARDQFKRAKSYLDRAGQYALETAKSFQKKEDKETDEAHQAYAFYLRLKIESVILEANSARTWDKTSENYTKGLEGARNGFHNIYEKYMNYVGAYSARYQEAIILQELGKTDEAIGILSQLIFVSPDPSLRSLKTRALAILGEIYSARSKPEELLKYASLFYEWKETTPVPSEYYRSEEGLKIHMIASHALVRLLKEQTADRAAYNKMIKAFYPEQNTPFAKIVTAGNRMNEYAVAQLRFVRNERSSFASDAEKLLNDPILKGEEDKATPSFSNSFEEVSQEAGRSWMAIVDETSKGAPSPATPQSQAEFEEKMHKATLLFRQASSLADSSVPAAKLNQLRFEWASLCFLLKRYEESAVLAGELCRSPDFASAVKAARIALFSLRQLDTQAREKGAKPETFAAINRHISDLVQFIDKRWGQSTLGEGAAVLQDALVVRIDTAISAGDITGAEDLLNRVTSPTGKSAAQLQLGVSLWNAYTKKIAENTERDGSAHALVRDLLQKSRIHLETGLKEKLSRSEMGAEDYFTVYCVLSLAQILLTQGDAKSAEQWLIHPVIGPLNIVENELESTKSGKTPGPGDNPFASGNFRMAVLVVALRCRVELGQFAEAQKIMELLESTGESGNETLLAVYVQLGRQLEQQLKETTEAARGGDVEKQKKLKEISTGFEQFLDRISARTSGNTYTTFRWVADTFLSLARGIAGTLMDTPQEAIDYYTKSGRAYQNILKQIEADPKWAGDKNAKLATTVRLVECLRGTGRFEGALKVLRPLLVENPNNLDLQLEAVKIFQDRGRIDYEYYVSAIVGGERQPNGQHLVWGWNHIISRLARVMNRDERYKELFYEACLSKLTCRYLYSRRLTDKAEIVKHAKEGEEELLRLYKTHPDLGGPVFRRRFEDHLKRLRQQQGIEKPSGFDQKS